MIRDVFGITIPLPIQTFGLFMALGFAIGMYLLYNSFKRLEKNGSFQPIIRKEWQGKPASIVSILVNGFFGFFIGYKMLHGILNYSSCAADPQALIMSTDGNWIGGILVALVLAGTKYYESNRTKLAEPKLVDQTILPYEMIGDLVMVAAVSGVLGAKLFHHLEYWEEFMKDPVGSMLSFSGLTYYGGLICGATAVLIYAFFKKIPLRHLADAAGPSLMIGYAVGRLGCHFSGDGDWGIVNPNPEALAFLPDWLWSYTYPNNVANDGVPIADCVGKYCRELPEGVYPTSVYEFVMGSGITLFLLSLRDKLRFPGMLFGIYLAFNGLERFIIETIRVNPRYDFLGLGLNLSQAQVIGLSLMTIGLLLAFFFYTYGKRETKLSI